MVDSFNYLIFFGRAQKIVPFLFICRERSLERIQMNGILKFKIAWLDSCIFQNNLLPLHAKYAMNEESAQ